MKAYAGVGSRQTPEDVLALMAHLAEVLALAGWTLRSGAARGADTAFEKGALHVQGDAEIYLPKPGFENRPNRLPYIQQPTAEAYDFTARYHPAWRHVKTQDQPLHARNAHQVLGYDLKRPSRFVVCWTRDGADGVTVPTSRATGGTGQAIRIAAAHEVGVFNLARPEHRARIEARLK